MLTLSVTEARAALPSLLDKVEAGEEVAITRHGKVVAVLATPTDRKKAERAAAREAALARAAQFRAEMEAARYRPLPPPTNSDPEYIREWIEEIDRGRGPRWADDLDS